MHVFFINAHMKNTFCSLNAVRHIVYIPKRKSCTYFVIALGRWHGAVGKICGKVHTDTCRSVITISFPVRILVMSNAQYIEKLPYQNKITVVTDK